MEIIEHLEESLSHIATVAKIFLEAMGILTIVIGIVMNFKHIIYLYHRPNNNTYIIVRTRVARALALALEFQLGADIVATTASATYENLAKLAIVAIIRTFLNYFLTKEIKEIQESNSAHRESHHTAKE